jgi:hypothetical protein
VGLYGAEFIRIPAKVRKITGVRLGGYYWGSAANLGSVLEKQKVQLISAANDTLSPVGLYGNIQSGGIYLGGSLATFRNVVIKPKKYDIAVNDILFTGYADILYAPYVRTANVRVDGTDYSTDKIKLRNLGFRAGIEGMFNRDFSWSYGGEIGYRPSLQNRGFYAMFKGRLCVCLQNAAAAAVVPDQYPGGVAQPRVSVSKRPGTRVAGPFAYCRGRLAALAYFCGRANPAHASSPFLAKPLRLPPLGRRRHGGRSRSLLFGQSHHDQAGVCRYL